jgi:galactokinase
MNRYADALQQSGMSAAEAEGKSRLFDQLQRVAHELGICTVQHAFFVPGRIEVLGKHTDYAGGRSLLCCVERGFCVITSSRRDRTLRFVDAKSGERSEFAFEEDVELPQRGWRTYPATVTRRIVANFPNSNTGADVLFASDLPRAAGMSSSSALVVASFLALAAVNHLADSEPYRRNIQSKEDLATYLGCVENGSTFRELPGDRGVGTFGGSEDHTAILCCEPGKISQFSFCPTRFERSLELPKELMFAIAVSGVVADKTGSALTKYNRLSLAVRSILEIWNRETGRNESSLAAALASSTKAESDLRKLLSSTPTNSEFPLVDRFEQFVSESTSIIPKAADALAARDWSRFGDHVDESQGNAEQLLKNQTAETVFLARTARQQGALAASAFGAGFGGSVWALVEQHHVEEFLREWSQPYRGRFSERQSSTFFLSRPGSSAMTLLR